MNDTSFTASDAPGATLNDLLQLNSNAGRSVSARDDTYFNEWAFERANAPDPDSYSMRVRKNGKKPVVLKGLWMHGDQEAYLRQFTYDLNHHSRNPVQLVNYLSEAILKCLVYPVPGINKGQDNLIDAIVFGAQNLLGDPTKLHRGGNALPNELAMIALQILGLVITDILITRVLQGDDLDVIRQGFEKTRKGARVGQFNEVFDDLIEAVVARQNKDPRFKNMDELTLKAVYEALGQKLGTLADKLQTNLRSRGYSWKKVDALFDDLSFVTQYVNRELAHMGLVIKEVMPTPEASKAQNNGHIAQVNGSPDAPQNLGQARAAAKAPGKTTLAP